MTDDDSTISRVRRAKARQAAKPPSRRVDGGAVAVGLVVALGAQLVAALVILAEVSPPIPRIVAILSTLAVPVGGYLAGKYAGSGATRGAVHGALVAVVVLPSTVLASFAVSESSPLAAARGVFAVGTGGDALLAGFAVTLVLVGAGAGTAGARRDL